MNIFSRKKSMGLSIKGKLITAGNINHKLSDFILYIIVAARLGGRFSSSNGYMEISHKLRNLILALPFCQITLKDQKPLPSAYPRILMNLGGHLRKRRIDLNLLQKEATQKIGVGKTSIYSWENNLAKPALKYIPKIIKFLRYMPFDTSTFSVGEKIITYLKLLGLSQKRLAHYLGIDPSTLGNWERNKRRPSERFLKDLTAFFKSYPSGT